MIKITFRQESTVTEEMLGDWWSTFLLSCPWVIDVRFSGDFKKNGDAWTNKLWQFGEDPYDAPEDELEKAPFWVIYDGLQKVPQDVRERLLDGGYDYIDCDYMIQLGLFGEEVYS